MRILCVDDMQSRHDKFKRWFIGHEVRHVYTAAEAIAELSVGVHYHVVMLDHDLADEHYRTETVVGMKGTGMDVALHICDHVDSTKPDLVIIHSLNGVGAYRMYHALVEAGVNTVRNPYNPLSPVIFQER